MDGRPIPTIIKPPPEVSAADSLVALNLDPEERADLANLLQKILNFSSELSGQHPRPPRHLSTLDLSGVAKYIQSGKCSNIIVMSGVGVSTAAGIPDFRSPSVGLYDKLERFNMPTPMSIFEMNYFRTNPEPFFLLVKELFPGEYKPTACHAFIKLLANKNLLLRNYTQNIDTLERICGIPDERIVEAHGSFHTATCINDSCAKKHAQEHVKAAITADQIPKCDDCGSIVKPDITFFGENLPPQFYRHVHDDFQACDLLIVMGTSLQVQPFASLINEVSPSCPRLLINTEMVGVLPPMMKVLGMRGGFVFEAPESYRDVCALGECDALVAELARLMGWEVEFNALLEEIESAYQVRLAAAIASRVASAAGEFSDDTSESTSITSSASSSSVSSGGGGPGGGSSKAALKRRPTAASTV